jgi:hypothetical protein
LIISITVAASDNPNAPQVKANTAISETEYLGLGVLTSEDRLTKVIVESVLIVV